VLVIRDTSTGTVVMRFGYISRSIGLSVGIGRVDNQGWVEEFISWSSESPIGQSLADAIVEAASIPQDEAESLAESALRELHERGGDKSDMTRSDWVKGGAFLTASVGIILVAIIAAVAALVWVAILVI
jgi:hypothetical protein